MNQILVNENKSKKNRSANVLGMKKVIIIFAIIVLLVALVIVGIRIYDIIKNNDKNKPIDILNKPEINIEEKGNNCILKVSYDEGMEKLIYYWNDGEIKESSLNGSTSLEKTIQIPEGETNTLYVKVIGVDNSENELTQVFQKEEEDINISWEQVNGTTDMIVKVSSKKAINNLTYQWENDEPVVVEGNGNTELEMTIEIKRGTNRINITVVDVEGNEQTKEETIVGILYPEINVYIQDNILYMSVKHDYGFRKIVFRVNNQELIYDENNPQYDTTLTELSTSLPVQPGKVEVEITAYSLEHEKSVKTYKGEVEIQ